MEQGEYLKDLAGLLLKYRRDRFLCDVIVVAAEGREVFAHSVILASASNKLRAAFEQQRHSRRSCYFRLIIAECDVTALEAVLQFVYTGSLPQLGPLAPEHITAVLLAGQKLGLDVNKLALILSAFVALQEPSSFEFPPFVLNDEDMYLEIIDKDANPGRAQALEIIKLTSRDQSTGMRGCGGPAGGAGGLRVKDHSYTNINQPVAVSGAPEGLQERVGEQEGGFDEGGVDGLEQEGDFGGEEEEKGGVVEDELGEAHQINDDEGILMEGTEADYAPEDAIGSEGAEQQINSEEYAQEPGYEAVPANHEEIEILSGLFAATRGDDSTEGAGGIKLEPGAGVQSESSAEGEPELRAEKISGVLQDSGDTSVVPYIVGLTEGGETLKKPLGPSGIVFPTTVGFPLRRPRGRPPGSGGGVRGMVGGSAKERVILICDLCGKSFQRAKEYAEHRRSHTGERPFSCDYCGKSFGRRRTMTEHRRIHTGDRPYLCDICEKRFSTSGELIKHRRFHTGERPYQCDVCGKTFARCGENADHRRMHAGELTCALCGKEFTRLHNMKEHLNSAHSGEKRFRCAACGKTFAYSSGLRYHRRLHREDRPFACALCGKGFARAGELGRHERSAHRAQVLEIEVCA